MDKKRLPIITIIILGIGFIFSWTTTSFSQQQPPISKPVAPLAGIKLDISIKSQIRLSPEIQNKLLAVSRDLVTQNLSSELSKGISSRAETNVIKQTPKGYIAETIVLNLLKDTYTAEMSRIEFAFEEGKTNIIKIDKTYQPRVAAIQSQVPQNINLEGEKRKLNIFKAANIPDHPDKLDYATGIKQAEEAELRETHKSWWRARGLANTPCTEFPSAVTATNHIHSIFWLRFGGSSAKRIGNTSTKNEIIDFLKNDNYLLCWNNIGHGVTSSTNGAPCYGLVQWDQTIWHNEFATLTPYTGIYWCVALANSCNSYKDPLHSAIWSRRPRTYIGGNINLHVNRSEFVARNFWFYALLSRRPMTSALEQAQRDKGYPVGTYGLRGDGGVF